jgi:hypothetical protein
MAINYHATISVVATPLALSAHGIKTSRYSYHTSDYRLLLTINYEL